MKDKMFGPQNAEESRVFAEEALLFDVQELISGLMTAKSMTQASLAKKMNVSAARVSQILNGEDSLTLRTVGNVFFALGEECQILCAKSRSWPKFGIEHVIGVPTVTPASWRVGPAGSDAEASGLCRRGRIARRAQSHGGMR